MSIANLTLHKYGFFSGEVDGYAYCYSTPIALRVAEDRIDCGEIENEFGEKVKAIEKSYCVVCLIADDDWRILHRETTLEAANNALHDILDFFQKAE